MLWKWALLKIFNPHARWKHTLCCLSHNCVGLQWPTTACLLLSPFCANIAFTKTHGITIIHSCLLKSTEINRHGRKCYELFLIMCFYIHHKQESNFLSDHKNVKYLLRLFSNVFILCFILPICAPSLKLSCLLSCLVTEKAALKLCF